MACLGNRWRHARTYPIRSLGNNPPLGQPKWKPTEPESRMSASEARAPCSRRSTWCCNWAQTVPGRASPSTSPNGTTKPPLYETSILPQKLRNGRLPDEFKLFAGPPPIEGFVHIVQQYALSKSEPLVVSCRASLTRNPRAEATLPGLRRVRRQRECLARLFRLGPPI